MAKCRALFVRFVRWLSTAELIRFQTPHGFQVATGGFNRGNREKTGELRFCVRH